MERPASRPFDGTLCRVMATYDQRRETHGARQSDQTSSDGTRALARRPRREDLRFAPDRLKLGERQNLPRCGKPAAAQRPLRRYSRRTDQRRRGSHEGSNLERLQEDDGLDLGRFRHRYSGSRGRHHRHQLVGLGRRAVRHYRPVDMGCYSLAWSASRKSTIW